MTVIKKKLRHIREIGLSPLIRRYNRQFLNTIFQTKPGKKQLPCRLRLFCVLLSLIIQCFSAKINHASLLKTAIAIRQHLSHIEMLAQLCNRALLDPGYIGS